MEITRTLQLARTARNFITLHRFGTLSTLSLEKEGHPFGSIAPYDVDSQGRVIIHAAKISQHYKNIKHEPRASLLVFDRFGMFNPQLHGRATFLTEFHAVPEEERDAVFASYDARFPGVINPEIAGTFVFLRGEPISIRWIGGFGEIAWVDAKHYLTAQHDPVCYAGIDIIHHMNEDHADALIDLVKAHSKLDPGSRYVEMTFVSAEGFNISVGGSASRENLNLKFPKPASSADEVRKMLIEMLKEARK